MTSECDSVKDAGLMTESSGLKRPFSPIVKALRIGAILCVVIAALTAGSSLLSNRSISQSDLIVSHLHVSESRTSTQFRLYCESPNGPDYDMPFPKRFYDAARSGDRLHSPFPGYTQLVRDGQVIRRHFSEDVVVPVVFSLIALLPLVSFVRPAILPLRHAALFVVGLIEVGVIGVFLYPMFFTCC